MSSGESTVGAAARHNGPILVVDTSFGLTIGIVGHEPLHEADSRQHVEKIEPYIARAIDEAGLRPSDIATVVVGTGPAPFTGLRAGIVSAKAFAFATGAELLGQDVLEPQAWWDWERRGSQSVSVPRLVLTLNDARRKQLYFQVFEVVNDTVTPLSDMDIQYPQTIVDRVTEIAVAHPGVLLDILGHGAEKYADMWESLRQSGIGVNAVDDGSVIHADGSRGLEIFALTALRKREKGLPTPTDPLYLRRPDVSLPPPLKPVLKTEQK
ncbi:MAG: tRNA (adenosine(37)-N6)-threonylcarbamoyltransferase complex dimerization subunit type 1 TsaB [Bifidobacteriaceae bacterium]|jgi:tRNA threonylcarbamoyl adenosine modification protein YeaZ|nr:tRNA (adenosine(37)-N6)-threonylcarbamoyltransferase complex dimerization subunit type 1 TsaB [Bifidobacteriaceae bacterium]